MGKAVKIILLLSFILMPSSSWAGKVKIYLDNSRTDFIMAEKMDCRVPKTKKGITLGFKAGNLLFGVGPEVNLGGEAKIAWDKAVQGIIVRYQELCSRFNTGTMTKNEYDERLKEIDAIAEEVVTFQDNYMTRVEEKAKDAFDELDRERDYYYSGQEIEKKIKEIELKIEGLIPAEDEQ